MVAHSKSGLECKKIRAPKVIKAGCDFSGLGTLSTALKRMLPSHKFIMKFQADKLPEARALAEHSQEKTKIFYDDVLDRELAEVPYTDVYVWTPPCQSFSMAGRKQGVKDPRGQLLAVGVKYVVQHKPRLAILENVKNLYSKKHLPVVKGVTKALKEAGYKVHWKVVRASDFQVPQDRDRLFMVAIHTSSLRCEFTWPEPRTPKVYLADILDDFNTDTDCAGRMPATKRQKSCMKAACAQVHKSGTDPLKVPVAIDVDCTNKFRVYGVNIAKTLTRSRGGSGGPWLSTRGRRTTSNELMRIMGFKSNEIPWKAAGLSKTKLGHMLGNAVPVPVLGCILQEAMYSAGLVRDKPNFPYTKK